MSQTLTFRLCQNVVRWCQAKYPELGKQEETDFERRLRYFVTKKPTEVEAVGI